MLDKNAIVFTRIWCGFEQATVVQGKKLLLDFATVHEGEAQLLTADRYVNELKDNLKQIHDEVAKTLEEAFDESLGMGPVDALYAEAEACASLRVSVESRRLHGSNPSASSRLQHKTHNF